MSISAKLKDPDFWIENCLSDLYFFSRNIICTIEDPSPGFKDLYYPTHKRLCNFIEKYAKPGQECLILKPRGWLKSYIITCAWLIQRILRNIVQNKRELWIINNATEPNAIELLSRSKYNLMFNDTLRALFRKIIPEDCENQAERWTQKQIQIKGNRIETGSVEKALESKHFGGGMINDDLVNWANSRTGDQLETTIDWWKISRSLKMPWSIIINIGTRWDEDDLYGYLISKFLRIPRKELTELRKQPIFEYHNDKYHLFEVCCYEDPVAESGSTFPIIYPEEEIKRLITEQGDIAGGQYLNDPLAMAKGTFKRHWFKTWQEHGIPEKGGLPAIRTTLMTIDPAESEKSTSDYTGNTVADAGVDKVLYVRFAERRHVTDLKLCEWIVETAVRFYPLVIGIEENKFRTIIELLELEIPQIIKRLEIPEEHREFARRIPYMCVELKHRGRPKPLRIDNLMGWIEGKRMLFAPYGMEDVQDELLRHPRTKRNDIADALAYILDLLAQVGFPRKDDPVKYLVVPDELKMSPTERMQKDWEKYVEDVEELEKEAYEEFEQGEDF